jgi:hypothetical protein
VNLRGEGDDAENRRVAIVSLGTWLDERLDLSGVRHFIAEKGVPVHTQKIWYYLGGMTLFLFGVQIFTGILLLLYYRPSASEAYESVQFIVTQVQFGWLIRNVHSWSANLLIGLAFAHFFSVFFSSRTEAAGADVVERHPAALPDARLRLQRLSPAVGRAGLLCDEGGDRHRRGGARSSVTSRCGCSVAATTSPARPCRGSMAFTSPSCRP